MGRSYYRKYNTMFSYCMIKYMYICVYLYLNVWYYLINNVLTSV